MVSPDDQSKDEGNSDSVGKGDRREDILRHATGNSSQRAPSGPLVSIGLPVYNGEQFIAQALDCFLSQTFSDFGIIICDNDSHDKTEQICREYARRDPRIRYYRNESNIGVAGNCRRVLDLATGKYFKYAAHDDLCAPQFLERCLEVLECHPDVVLAYPKTKLLNELSGELVEYEEGMNLGSPRPSERFLQLMQHMRLCNTIFGLVRTVEMRKTAGYPAYLGGDIVLMAELSLRGKFYEIPEYLFYRRFHPSAASSIKDQKQLETYLEPSLAKGERMHRREWNHLVGHFRSTLRTPLPITERARLMLALLRILLWKRKELFKELWVAGQTG
jgi:glycosyltransferase involved in cell wall biosynthesis